MIEIKNNNFESEIREGLVLVDFYARWCGPCRMITPILEQLDQQYKGKVKIVKVDIDANPVIASRYGVMSIPNLMLFKNGKLSSHMLGFKTKSMLEEWINQNL